MRAWNDWTCSARRRRRPNWPGAGGRGLTDAQDAMLVRFGYPYVLNTWFFHMTLTRRLSAAEHAIWRPEVERFFAAAIAVPRRVVRYLLVHAGRAGEPFVIAERIASGGVKASANPDTSLISASCGRCNRPHCCNAASIMRRNAATNRSTPMASSRIVPHRLDHHAGRDRGRPAKPARHIGRWFPVPAPPIARRGSQAAR